MNPPPARGMTRVRLRCATFYVDVRLREMNGRFIASADTPDGPSLGIGIEALQAIEGALEPFEAALEPFEGAFEDLLASLPRSVGGLRPPT